MPAWFIELVGWLPGIIFPAASGLQLAKLIRSSNIAGVSVTTWILFSIANVGMYLYTEKFVAPQALALLLTAVIQAMIVLLALIKKKQLN